jgi:hypothetical protein
MGTAKKIPQAYGQIVTFLDLLASEAEPNLILSSRTKEGRKQQEAQPMFHNFQIERHDLLQIERKDGSINSIGSSGVERLCTAGYLCQSCR